MNTDLVPPLVRGLVSVPLLSAGDNSRVRTKWGEYRDQVAFRDHGREWILFSLSELSVAVGLVRVYIQI